MSLAVVADAVAGGFRITKAATHVRQASRNRMNVLRRSTDAPLGLCVGPRWAGAATLHHRVGAAKGSQKSENPQLRCCGSRCAGPGYGGTVETDSLSSFWRNLVDESNEKGLTLT